MARCNVPPPLYGAYHSQMEAAGLATRLEAESQSLARFVFAPAHHALKRGL